MRGVRGVALCAACVCRVCRAGSSSGAPRRAVFHGGIGISLLIVLTTEQCSVILLLAPQGGAQIWSDHVHVLR